MPGIRRRRRGKGFSYLHDKRGAIRDADTLARIASLAIPPAYERVWICAAANGHLQATGRDAAGRKQYRYHPRWQEHRSGLKYARLVAFARALPRLRRHVAEDLARPTLDRPRVIAAAVRLMELSLIRAGHGGETDGKPTFGLATLRSKHVAIRGGHIQLAFRGKSGRVQEREIESRRLARTLRRCHGLPGHQLFQYLDEQGTRHGIDAGDLNDYIRDAIGIEATAKDFRTWGATVYAAATLTLMGPAETVAQTHKNIVEAVRLTAEAIGNRPATCRKYYIAPAVIEAYEAGTLFKAMNERPDPRRPAPRRGLGAEERAVLKLLKKAARSGG